MTKAKIVITKVGDVMAKARSISHIQRTIVPISSIARSLESKVMLNRRLTTKENDRFICGGPHDYVNVLNWRNLVMKGERYTRTKARFTHNVVGHDCSRT